MSKALEKAKSQQGQKIESLEKAGARECRGLSRAWRWLPKIRLPGPRAWARQSQAF